MCIDPHQARFVGKGSDRLQLIEFWPSRAPGKGPAPGRKFLAPPYYRQRTVFASPLSVFFHLRSKLKEDEIETTQYLREPLNILNDQRMPVKS